MPGVSRLARRHGNICRRRDRKMGQGDPNGRHQGGVRMRTLHAIAAILLCIGAAPASAQTWPAAKPITIVVPVPPGPTIDMIARLIAAKLQESLGQTTIVDNRSGANGMIGSTLVAHAAPDGYTLLAATPASH